MSSLKVQSEWNWRGFVWVGSIWVYRKTDNLPKPCQFHSDWTFKGDIHYLVGFTFHSKSTT